MGSTYSPSFGFVMSGGFNHIQPRGVVSTFDGFNFDNSTIAHLPEPNQYHCMATGPDGTIYTIGGDQNYRAVYEFKVNIYSIPFLKWNSEL